VKILLLGAAGQVGFELAIRLPALGDVTAIDRDELDLTDGLALKAYLDRLAPDLIVNAAAYTAVDKAEQEQSLAHHINAEAPAALADWASQSGAALVHYSTDYVFDGLATSAYTEEMPCAPMGVYGQSKRLGEQAIVASGCRHLILRTSWVYGGRGQNFLLSILGHASNRDQLSIVDDQWGSPSWCGALAENTIVAISRLVPGDDWARLGGLYHLSANGQTTWCRFARRFVAMAVDKGLLARAPEIRPISTADWPTPAARPAFSVLDNSLFQDVFGLRVDDWQDQLSSCMAGMEQL
jgi:dTDP-4-dehydrorhamnose reductase